MERSNNIQNQKGLILVGHGGIPTDCPDELIQKFMALHKKRTAQGLPATKMELELERTIRLWPRDAETDPYKAGLESLASHLANLLAGWTLKTAYNEFCAPSIREAVESLVNDDVKEIVLVTTMLTPGGSHSEKEIPEEVAKLQNQFKDVSIYYAWPFNLEKVAELLAAHVANFPKPTALTSESF